MNSWQPASIHATVYPAINFSGPDLSVASDLDFYPRKSMPDAYCTRRQSTVKRNSMGIQIASLNNWLGNKASSVIYA